VSGADSSKVPVPVPVLAIDGPSGSGKGTIAREVADALGWHRLDSGALYRLAGLAAARQGQSGAAPVELARLSAGLNVRFGTDPAGAEQVWLDGDDVTAAIRTEECGRLASHIARIPEVRDALIGLQRGFRRAPGLVADGRDMGSRIFPDASVKVFLTASAAERAKRRYKQLKDKGIDVSLPALSRDIAARDRRDSERSVAPLRPAVDARVLDSSNLTIEDVTRTVLDWVRDALSAKEC
jgi:CMP/dCMP kinase